MSQVNNNSGGNQISPLGYLGHEPITPVDQLLQPDGSGTKIPSGTIATPRPKAFPSILGRSAVSEPRAENGSAKDLSGTKQVSLPIKSKLTVTYFENDAGRGTSLSGQAAFPLGSATKINLAGSYEYREPVNGTPSSKLKLGVDFDRSVSKDDQNSLNAGLSVSVALTDTYAAGKADKYEFKAGPFVFFKHRFGSSGFDAHARVSIQRSETFLGPAAPVGKYVLAGQGGFGKSLGKNGGEIHLDAVGELNLSSTGPDTSSVALILGGTIPIWPKQGVSLGLDASYTVGGSGSGTPSFPFAENDGNYGVRGFLNLSL